jgi:hypothetical protein
VSSRHKYKRSETASVVSGRKHYQNRWVRESSQKVHGCISDTYQFGDKRYRLPPGSNVWHAVDVAVERVVSRVPETKVRRQGITVLSDRNKQFVFRSIISLWRERRCTEVIYRTAPTLLLLTKNHVINFNVCVTSYDLWGVANSSDG